MKSHRTCSSVTALLLALVLTGISCSKQDPSDQTRIEPNVGVGVVRRGMNQEQVQAKLGPPDREGKKLWRYPQLGLRLSFDKEGIISSIHCRKSFTGTTKEGIGIGSSRGDVIKAFGPPTEEKSTGADKVSLVFSSQNLNCILENDSLVELVVRLGNEP